MKYLVPLLLLAGCASPPTVLEKTVVVISRVQVSSLDFDGGLVTVTVRSDGMNEIDVMLFDSEVQLRHTTSNLPATFAFGGYVITISVKHEITVDEEKSSSEIAALETTHALESFLQRLEQRASRPRRQLSMRGSWSDLRDGGTHRRGPEPR